MNKNDIIAIMLSNNEFWTYVVLLFTAIFVGLLNVLRSVDRREFKTRGERVNYIIYGTGSSMLVTWICYESLSYFTHTPSAFDIAVSGGAGFLGAETFTALFLRYVSKRYFNSVDINNIKDITDRSNKLNTDDNTTPKNTDDNTTPKKDND